MRGPGGAFVLVAVQLLAGTFAAMWFVSVRHRVINRGYFRSTTWVLWPLLAAASGLLPKDLKPLGFGVAGLWLVYLVCVYSHRPLLEWVAGAAGALAGIGLTGAIGQRLCEEGCVLGIVHSMAGLLFMGAVTHGMTLGHWYLNQARLPIGPLSGATKLLFAAIAISFALGIATRSQLVSGVVAGGILPVSGSAYWLTWLLLNVATGGLALMIHATVKQRSTQSATGLLYIAIVTALGAQFLLNLLAAT